MRYGSVDVLHVLQPFDVESLLAVNAVVNEQIEGLSLYAQVRFQKSIDSFEKFVRQGFDFGACVLVGLKDVVAVSLGCFKTFVKVDAGDFEALGDDGVDYHSFGIAGLGDEDCNFIEVVIEIFLLFSFSFFRLLFSFFLSEISWRLNVGKQTDIVVADFLGQLDKSSFLRYTPAFFFEIFLVRGKIGQVLFFSFDFSLNCFLVAANLGNSCEVESRGPQEGGGGDAEAGSGSDSFDNDTRDHLNQRQINMLC